MARINVAKKSVVADERKVSVVFSNGKAVEVGLADLSPEMVERLALHGLSQKLGDSYSGSGGDVMLAQGLCEATKDALLKGDWSQRGEGDGGMLADALAELTGQDLTTVRAKVAELSKEQKEGLKKRKDVKAVMARIKAERLAKQVGDEEAPLPVFLTEQAE